MKKLSLGLDVGIASVGWGLIDIESGNAIDAGVRLFPEADAEQNLGRRSFRSNRRVKRRRVHRLERMKKLLQQAGIIDESFRPLGNPYEIRCRALKEKVKKPELATALLHIAKHRGTDNVEIIEDTKDGEEESKSTKEQLSRNQHELRGRYICELQYERLNKEGRIRGEKNRFRTDDYVREVEAILDMQGVEGGLRKEIVDIIRNRRAYYEGPGSRKSPTPYGRFYYDDHGEIIEVDMIEKMRGRCSLFPEELRASKMSYTASLFNLLNDLNNLEYSGQKISPDQKREIIEQIVDVKGGITPKSLAKYLGCAVEEINGFRVNKKGDPLLTSFDGPKKIRKAVGESMFDKIFQEKRLLDGVIDILTGKKGVEERKKAILELDPKSFDDRIAGALSIIPTISGYHALSYKAMDAMMDDLWETDMNQMQIITASGLHNDDSENLKGWKNIPFNDESILSPVVRRSFHEAVKVVNAVRNHYGELESVVVEMARDRNSEEKRKRIKDEQKRGESIRDAIREKVGDRHISAKMYEALRLYDEQEGKCLYTGKPIDLKSLIGNLDMFDIDHIIPLSVSFDDSLNNKALCYADANRKKGQKTPFAYLSSGKEPGRSFKTFKEELLTMKNIPRKKREYLLFERDIDRYDVRREFVNRNLVDTRYATRELLGMLKRYYEANDVPTTIHAVRGAVTATFRKKAGIPKDRDENFSHHAVDALIVAGIRKMRLMDKVFRIFVREEDGETYTVDSRTGEVIDRENETEYFDSDFIAFVRHLRESVPATAKYSHKIDRKPDRELADQTLYGIREYDDGEWIIAKYKDIYGKEGEALKKLLIGEKGKGKGVDPSESLLIARHDPETYALLRNIVDEYMDEPNPFAKYRDEHGPIRKRAKSGNGPVVKSLRYRQKRLGSHIDISHKYQDGKGGKVVLLSVKPFRIDIYRDSDGKYRFLKLSRRDVRRIDEKWTIDQNLYEEKMRSRGIEETDEFLFSLHRNDIFGYEKDGHEHIVRYNGTSDNDSNVIEYKHLDRNDKKQLFETIGGKITNLQKYSTDVLGNRYRVRSETCLLQW